MAFSYDVTQLDSSPLFQVRFRLGDTVESTASFQDGEITYSLNCNQQDVLSTCIDCISALLPRIASKSKFSLGPYSEEEGKNSYEYWSKLLNELKAKQGGYAAPINLPPTGPPIFHYNMMGTEASRATDSD